MLQISEANIHIFQGLIYQVFTTTKKTDLTLPQDYSDFCLPSQVLIQQKVTMLSLYWTCLNAPPCFIVPLLLGPWCLTTALHCTALHCTIQNCTVQALHCTTQTTFHMHFTALHKLHFTCTSLHYTKLRCTCTVLYCTTLNCMAHVLVMHCTALHSLEHNFTVLHSTELN